jgi:hypothetical protein
MWSAAFDILALAAGGYLEHVKMRDKWKASHRMKEALSSLKKEDERVQKISLQIFQMCQANDLSALPQLFYKLQKKGLEAISCLPIAYCVDEAAEAHVWGLLNEARLNHGLPQLPGPL